MAQIGKRYVYKTRSGQMKISVLTQMTKAWYIFENGDWIERYRPVYETEEQLLVVENIVAALEKTVHVPDVVHVPNRFLK